MRDGRRLDCQIQQWRRLEYCVVDTVGQQRLWVQWRSNAVVAVRDTHLLQEQASLISADGDAEDARQPDMYTWGLLSFPPVKAEFEKAKIEDRWRVVPLYIQPLHIGKFRARHRNARSCSSHSPLGPGVRLRCSRRARSLESRPEGDWKRVQL